MTLSRRSGTWRGMVAAAVFLAAVALDARRAPQVQVSTRAALAGIHVYQATLSPLYGRLGIQCRFAPTCSRYGEVVIRQFGIARGGWMAMRRIARCGPWTPAGTADPPPLP